MSGEKYSVNQLYIFVSRLAVLTAIRESNSLQKREERGGCFIARWNFRNCCCLFV